MLEKTPFRSSQLQFITTLPFSSWCRWQWRGSESIESPLQLNSSLHFGPMNFIGDHLGPTLEDHTPKIGQIVRSQSFFWPGLFNFIAALILTLGESEIPIFGTFQSSLSRPKNRPWTHSFCTESLNSYGCKWVVSSQNQIETWTGLYYGRPWSQPRS